MSQANWLVGNQNKLKPSTIRVALVVFILLTFAARLIHLEADFPEGLTWSSAPYSDEGWYSNAAISYELRDQLYLEGDFNPIVNLPLLQLVQAVMFKAFGMGLVTARLTIIGFFGILLVGVYTLVRRFMNDTAALIALALLSVNFHLFAFSRLALLEIPMTSLLVASLALTAPSRRSNYARAALTGALHSNRRHFMRSALAGAVFSLAVLTKTTALFALPVLIYLSLDKNLNVPRRVLTLLIMLGVLATVLIAHFAWANLSYPADYQYFNSLNLEPRIQLTAPGIGRNLLRTLWHARVIDTLLYLSTLGLLPVFLLISEKFRRNRLVIASILWMMAYVLTLSMRGYLPPRYYVAMTIPIVILISSMAITAVDRLQPRRLALLPPLLLALLATVNLVQVVNYLRSPQFTLMELAADISRRVEPQGGPIMGGMANTLSLATGLPSINSKMGTGDLAWRVRNYSPTHYVSVGFDHETIGQLREMGELVQLESYDVFGNYNNGRQVRLYRLILDSE